jgi:hypothetical protein
MHTQGSDGTQRPNRVGGPVGTASSKGLARTVRLASRISTDETVGHFSINNLFGTVGTSGLANHIRLG